MSPLRASDWITSRMALALTLVLYLVIVFLTFNQIEEDAFIYLRLAANLGAGHGYVFNVGGEVIESGSSLLWQLMLVPLAWLPLDPIISLKLLGIAFGGLAILLTHAISRLLISDPVLRACPSLLLAVSVPFYCWSQRGLESPFYLCALLALCLVYMHERAREHWYLVAAVVFCARPEGFVILVAPIACMLAWRASIPHFWRGFAILGVVGVGVTLGRLAYFHDPFPHPFYIKAAGDAGLARAALPEYLRFNALALLAIPLLIGLSRRPFWNRRLTVVLSLLVVTGLWAFATADPKPYHRHILPLLPFFYLASIASLELWTERRAFRMGVRVAVPVFAVAMLTLSPLGERGVAQPNLFTRAASAALQHPLAYAASIGQLLVDPSESFIYSVGSPFQYSTINTNYQATTGKFLRDNYPQNITIVYDQMGQTPWYAGADKVMIDSFGLLSKNAGYYAFTRRADQSRLLSSYQGVMVWLAQQLWPDEQRAVEDADALDAVFERRPELILVNSFVTQSLPEGLTARIARDPRIASDYELAYIVNRIVRIYERKDIYSPDRTRVPRGAIVRNLAAVE